MQDILLSHAWNIDKPGLEFLQQEYWFGEAEPVDNPEQEDIEEPDTILKTPSWLKTR